MSRRAAAPTARIHALDSRGKRRKTHASKRSQQALWRVSIDTSLEAEEPVTELLTRILGQPVSSYTELETGLTSVTCFLRSKRLWSKSTREKLYAGLRRIQDCGLSLGRGKVAFRKLRPQDWAQAWKHHFKPFCLGPALAIRPSWARLQPRAGRRVVVLDPGLSFGTGQHPTTRFCLRQLAARRAVHPGQSFLDVGTGSGILAIAAAKLRYTPVRALDFDREAIAVARANACRNRLARKIQFRQQDVCKLSLRPSRRYSVICANLIAPLLISQRARILARLEKAGRLVLAGILKTEFESVKAAYEAAGLRLVKTRVENEWCSGSFAWAQLGARLNF